MLTAWWSPTTAARPGAHSPKACRRSTFRGSPSIRPERFCMPPPPPPACGSCRSDGAIAERVISVIFALLFSAAAAVAPDFNSIDAAARQFMSNTKTPGVAVAIVRGSDVVYAKGFGVASLDAPSPVTADTLFQIGSLTTVFTAATILSLAAQGKIRLDVPVGNYVSGLNPSIARLTASQLLSHTAGLKDEPAEYGSHDERAFAEYPRSWTSAYAILPPGTTFSYSNPGFTLAGLMVQEAAGEPFPQLVEERVFTPLSMKHSTFRPTVAICPVLSLARRDHGHRPGLCERTVTRVDSSPAEMYKWSPMSYRT